MKKVSRKEYRDKQNQATGQLVVSILALLMICFSVFQYFVYDQPFKWSDLMWVIMMIVTFATWRWREKRLKTFVVDES